MATMLLTTVNFRTGAPPTSASLQPTLTCLPDDSQKRQPEYINYGQMVRHSPHHWLAKVALHSRTTEYYDDVLGAKMRSLVYATLSFP
jgi:hypothetical protein